MAWFGQKLEYDGSELRTYAESVENDKQLVAVLTKGTVVKSDSSVNAKSLKGIYVNQTEEFASKTKVSAANNTSSIRLRNVSRTTVGFDLETAGKATVSITTADGSVIAKLAIENGRIGYNSLNWNMENIPSGRYTVTVEHNGFVSSKNILMK